MTKVRDGKIRTEVRANQIAEFVTKPSFKKTEIKFYNVSFDVVDIVVFKIIQHNILLVHDMNE